MFSELHKSDGGHGQKSVGKKIGEVSMRAVLSPVGFTLLPPIIPPLCNLTEPADKAQRAARRPGRNRHPGRNRGPARRAVWYHARAYRAGSFRLGKFFTPRRGVTGHPEIFCKKGLTSRCVPCYIGHADGTHRTQAAKGHGPAGSAGAADSRPRAGPQTAGTRRNTTGRAGRAQPASTLKTEHEAPPTRTG